MDIKDVVRAYEQKLSGLVDYFDERLGEAQQAAVSEAMAPSQKAEEQRVIDFVNAHPIIGENKALEAELSKLYGANYSIEEAYEMATHKLGIEEAANEEQSEEETNKNNDETSEQNNQMTSSFKSTQTPAGVDEGTKEGEDTRSLQEIIQANVNKVNAEMENNGD